MKNEALLREGQKTNSFIMKMITGVAYPTTGEVIVKGRVSALLELTSGFDSELTGRKFGKKGRSGRFANEMSKSVAPPLSLFP